MPPRKSNKKSDAVWEHFTNKPDIGKAECNICKILLKNNRISNLKTHLLKLHKIDVNNIDSATNSSNYICERKHNVKVQINKKILFRSYIGLVTEDNIPFNILNSPNLRNIVDPICVGFEEKYGKAFVLNATNCQKALKSVAEKIRSSLTTEMKNKLLSLKIDSASRLSRNVFGISAQLIKEDQIKSHILGMVELKGVGATTSDNLASEIIKTLRKYEINLNQIVSITSDNGANMIKATRILSSLNTGNESEEEYLTKDYLKNINDLEKPLNLSVGNIQICRCAAHTAQLCALDVTKDGDIKEFLLSCRNITKYIRKPSNGFRDTFELRNLKIPQLDCSTRWGSTYNMLEALLSAKEVLFSIESRREKTSEDNFENCDSLWDFIESYVAVFHPLQKTIIKFQEEHLHYGNFYADWLKCKILTEKVIVSNTSKKLIDKIGTKLLQCIEKRTTIILQNEGLNACLFLDPRFHHMLTAQKRQEAVVYLKHVWEKLRVVSVTSNDTSTQSFEGDIHPFEDEGYELLNAFLKENLQSTSGEIVYTDVYSKIANLHLPFMRSDGDVLMFWRERKHSEPELYALSSVCFGIPPTQVTVERAFSSLKLILTDNRNRLSHETLEDILLVKLNSTYINEAINSMPLFEDMLPQNE